MSNNKAMTLPEPKIPFVDQQKEYQHPPLGGMIDDGRAWTLDTIDPDNTIIHLDDTQLAELKDIARDLIENPLPELMHRPDQINAPGMSAAMNEIRKLLAIPGIGVIDRLPLDDIDYDTAKKIYWILGQMVSLPVAQK